jgi:hypothetical protein
MPIDIKRALKDKAYLDSLSKEQLKEALELVAGSQALGDAELENIAGGLPPRAPCGKFDKGTDRSPTISC